MRVQTILTALLTALLLIGSSASAACKARCLSGMDSGSCAQMPSAMKMSAAPSAARAPVQSAGAGGMLVRMHPGASLEPCASSLCAPLAPALNKDHSATLAPPLTLALWPTHGQPADRSSKQAPATRAWPTLSHWNRAQSASLRV